MKNQILFICTLFILAVTSCKSQTGQREPKPTKEPTVYKGVTDPACSVEMAFGSYGSGIDGKAYEKVIALIEKHKLKYTAKNIGREGETRICLPLKELKGKKKTAFINELKKIAKEAQLVSVSIK